MVGSWKSTVELLAGLERSEHFCSVEGAGSHGTNIYRGARSLGFSRWRTRRLILNWGGCRWAEKAKADPHRPLIVPMLHA